MTERPLLENLDYWTRQYEEAERAVREAVARRTAIEHILEGARMLQAIERGDQEQPEAQPDEPAAVEAPAVSAPGNGTVDAESPRGREAIRRIMRGSSRSWKQAELVAEVKRRRWIDPDAKDPNAAVRVAVRRMTDAKEVEKVRTGVYRYVAR